MSNRHQTHLNRAPLALALAAVMLLPAGAAFAQSADVPQDKSKDESSEAAKKKMSKRLMQSL